MGSHGGESAPRVRKSLLTTRDLSSSLLKAQHMSPAQPTSAKRLIPATHGWNMQWWKCKELKLSQRSFQHC